MPEYSAKERKLICMRLTSWRKETIARKLGKSRQSIHEWCNRHHESPRNQHLLTSGEAARLIGCSCQWLTELARQGTVKARREPGGRWWLFRLEDLPQSAPQFRVARQRAAYARWNRNG